MAVFAMIAAGCALVCAMFVLISRITHSARTPLDETVREAALHSRATGSRYIAPPKRAIMLLKRLLKNDQPLPALVFAHQQSRTLSIALHRLQTEASILPPLPSSNRTVRMSLLCRAVLRQNETPSARDLIDALQTWQATASTTFYERTALPVIMQLHLFERLETTLSELLSEAEAYRKGVLLAKQLIRIRKPLRKLLHGKRPDAVSLYAMLETLRNEHQHELLAALDELMHESGTSASRIRETRLHHQTALAKQISHYTDCIAALQRINWPQMLSHVDPIHRVYLRDVSGCYPNMTAESQQAYCKYTSRLAARFRVDEARLANACLDAAHSAQDDSPRDHVGYYLLTAAGQQMIRQRLNAHSGWLRTWISGSQPQTATVMTVVLTACFGWLALDTTQALFPALLFLLAVAPALRALCVRWLKACFAIPTPQMSITCIEEPLRTLIVLPTVLRDSSEAVAAMRKLLIARDACPDGAIDLMLLADFSENMTVHSADDGAIIDAASSAAEAISSPDSHVIYIQRGRTLNQRRRICCGSQGMHGLWGMLNPLLVSGECSDVPEAINVDPAFLNRRYAYLLILTDDAQLLPDALPALIGAMEHPLFEGSMLTLRSSKESHSVIQPMLYRPDDFVQECTALPFQTPPLPAVRARAGCEISARFAVKTAEQHANIPYHTRWNKFYDVWRSAPWLGQAQTARLWSVWSNFAALLLFLAGGMTRQPLLLLFGTLSFLIPTLENPQCRRNLLFEAVLLPMHTVIELHAVFCALSDLVRDRPYPSANAADLLTPHRISLIMNWSQLTACTILAGFSLIAAPPVWSSLLICLLFAMYPLLHLFPTTFRQKATVPNETRTAFLADIAKDTWRYFENILSSDVPALPPATVQQMPQLGPDTISTPQTLVGTLLAAISASRLRLISWAQAARIIANMTDTCIHLDKWHGLFYAEYQRDSMEPLQPLRIESMANGLMCYALTLAAQALRVHLPDIPEDLRFLSEKLDKLANEMALEDLFDPETGLFYESIALPERIGSGHHAVFASQALVLSFVSIMRRNVPPEHILRLDRSCVRSNGLRVQLSETGSVADYALAALLLPCPDGCTWDTLVTRAMRIHAMHGINGLHGVSSALSQKTDARLRSRPVSAGLPVLSYAMPVNSTLIAPYAAAMLAKRFPLQGIDTLRQLQSLGMQGNLGLYDGYDPETAADATSSPARAYNTLHQAFLLCACCDCLGHGISEYFAMLPDAAAWAPILQMKPHKASVLSPLSGKSVSDRQAPPLIRSARKLSLPADVHIIGSTDVSALATADGFTVMQGDSSLWTRFTATAGYPEGLRFFVASGRKSIRIGSSWNTEFHEGYVVYHERLGKVQIRLHVVTDVISGVVWHLLEMINHAANDRQIAFGDYLQPAETAVEPSDVTAEQPTSTVAQANIRLSDGYLLHTLAASSPLLSIKTAADAASLDPQLAESLHTPRDGSACISFLCHANLHGSGRLEIAFATTHSHDEGVEFPARMPLASSLLTASQLYSRIQARELGILPEDAMHALRAASFLCMKGLPHHGAYESLTVPRADLCTYGLNVSMPLLLLSVSTDDCLARIEDVFRITAMMTVRGFPVTLCIFCRGRNSDALRHTVMNMISALPEKLTRSLSPVVLDASLLPHGVRSTLEASAALILNDKKDLLPQLRAITLPLEHAVLPPNDPLELPPEPPLQFAEAYGGFCESTNGYVHFVQPGDSTPSAWTRMLGDRRYGVRVSAEGPLASFGGPMLQTVLTYHPAIPAESYFLEEDGQRISPCLFPYGLDAELRVHHMPGAVVWLAAANGLEIRLTLSPVPGYGAGVRLMRIRNRSDRAREVLLCAAACLAPGKDNDNGACTCITCLSGLAVATSPECSHSAYFYTPDDGAEVTRISTAAYIASLGLQDTIASQPAPDAGSTAMIKRRITLEAGAAAHACFILGAARTMDELERATEHIRTLGASATLRIARQQLTRNLGRTTISTPDPALDLVMNRLLPDFLQTPAPEQTLFSRLLASAALIHTSARTMRARLLNASAGMNRTDPNRLLLPLLTDWYIRRTGDESILEAKLPVTDDMQADRDTLAGRCMQILTGVTLSSTGLPLIDGTASRLNGKRYIASLRAFVAYVPENSRQDLVRMISLVTEAVNRTPGDESPCREACWAVFAGIASSLPAKYDPSDFEEACLLLHAMCLTHQYDQAWQLVQWLNPVLHHSVQTPPWQPEKDSHSMHSALLYLTILENLLGYTQKGNSVTMHTHLPPEWDTVSLQINIGEATWHIDCARGCEIPRLDGVPLTDGVLRLTDDGKIHQARFPAN